jgi:hypothetical protein
VFAVHGDGDLAVQPDLWQLHFWKLLHLDDNYYGMSTLIYIQNCCRIQVCEAPNQPFTVPPVIYAAVTGSGVLSCENGIVIPMYYYPDTGGPGPFWWGQVPVNCTGEFPSEGCVPPNVCATCQLNFYGCQENGLPNMNFLFQWVKICISGPDPYYGGSSLSYTYPPFSCTYTKTGLFEFCAEASPVGSGAVTVVVSETQP